MIWLIIIFIAGIGLSGVARQAANDGESKTATRLLFLAAIGVSLVRIYIEFIAV